MEPFEREELTGRELSALLREAVEKPEYGLVVLIERLFWRHRLLNQYYPGQPRKIRGA